MWNEWCIHNSWDFLSTLYIKKIIEDLISGGQKQYKEKKNSMPSLQSLKLKRKKVIQYEIYNAKHLNIFSPMNSYGHKVTAQLSQ